MMDVDKLHKQIRDALNDGDVDVAISLVRDNDMDIDGRDVTHDLQTILMKICYITLDTSVLQSILEAIFDKDPDVNIQDSWGRTVLMHSCIANKPVIVEGLLEYENTDISLIDFDGNSALSYAVQNCDIYTLEDILQHPSGHRLLSIHNAKGQTPYKIAQKSGDQSIIRLFDSYMNKTIGLQEKKSRKPRHRDVIRLPPAYSPSPERRAGYSSRRRDPVKSKELAVSPKICGSSSEQKENTFNTKLKLRLGNELLDRGAYNNATSGKCDSAPVVRSDRGEIVSYLSLTSARMARRHHKQDCLLQESKVSSQTHVTLPPMCNPEYSENDSGDEDRRFPENNIRRQRRPSISLPDLRDFTGNLVSSGNSTPSSGSRSNIAKSLSPGDGEYSTDEDDVFSQSYPSVIQTKQKKNTLSKRQFTLPDISPRTTTLTSPQISRKGFTSLERQRKYSTSDDQLRRTVPLHDSC